MRWLSQESGGDYLNHLICPPGYWLQGWNCGIGKHCDAKWLKCQLSTCPSAHWSTTSHTSILYESPWFSNEEIGESCPENQYVVGLKCEGKYCDKMKLICAWLAN